MSNEPKIPRLPKSIREQINERLENGMAGKELLEWLNALPEVQSKWKGKPISEVNLSRWRTGPYQNWRLQKDFLKSKDALKESTPAMDPAARHQFINNMVNFLAHLVGLQLQRLHSMPDSLERTRLWREVRMTLQTLRRDELLALRVAQELQKDAKTKKKSKSSKAEDIERTRMLIFPRRYDGAKNPELNGNLPDEDRKFLGLPPSPYRPFKPQPEPEPKPQPVGQSQPVAANCPSRHGAATADGQSKPKSSAPSLEEIAAMPPALRPPAIRAVLDGLVAIHNSTALTKFTFSR
jgi:hypothetical protein